MTDSSSIRRASRLLLAGVAMSIAVTGVSRAQAPSPSPEERPPAQGEAVPDDSYFNDEEAIIVVGTRDPNAVIGDIPAENQLNARDIRAYGASSVAELLDAIAPQTHSARGRGGGAPVVLLNGRRISGFREIRDLPPEAILRMDILPEEVALKYGYRADQRVVNIILRPRFRSTATRGEIEFPTAGGQTELEADATRLMIGENGRTSFNVRAESTSAITEDERDIAPPTDPSAVDPRPFRTLQGSSRMARIGGNHNRSMFGNVSSTFDAQLEWNDRRSLLGPSLDRPGAALTRDSDSYSAHAGVAFNGDRGRWRWSLTGAYDLSRTVTLTDREDDLPETPARDRARSTSGVGGLDFVTNGPLFAVPAGDASATVRVGADTRDLDSRARRGTAVTESDLGRDRLSGSVNFDLPISRRNRDFSVLGNLSLNANAEVERLSDFDTLTTVGGGIVWSPFEPINLIGSFTREDGAPSLQQLGDPVIATPDSRIFDFVRGETALVELISGGNPRLAADSRRVFKLGATARPLKETDLELRADFVSTRIDDPIARFPGPTAAIEAAFPDRFTRDSEGRLVRVDLRPVNYHSSAQDELRWGFNFTRQLRSARPSQETMNRLRDQAQRRGISIPTAPPAGGGGGDAVMVHQGEGAGPPRGGGRGFGGGRFGGGPFGGRGGRLQLSVYHTIALKDEVRIGPGLPVLDYLDGEAAEGGGGRPRHRVEADAGWFNNGLGMRLSANWQAGTRVDGGSSGTLDFEPLARFNLTMFANLGERLELITKYPWLRGTQVRLRLENILNEKQRVRDAAGFTPVNYQPDLLDPQGRNISISIRKLFLPPPRFFRRAASPSN